MVRDDAQVRERAHVRDTILLDRAVVERGGRAEACKITDDAVISGPATLESCRVGGNARITAEPGYPYTISGAHLVGDVAVASADDVIVVGDHAKGWITFARALSERGYSLAASTVWSGTIEEFAADKRGAWGINPARANAPVYISPGATSLEGWQPEELVALAALFRARLARWQSTAARTDLRTNTASEDQS